jgi:hypothetical protein
MANPNNAYRKSDAEIKRHRQEIPDFKKVTDKTLSAVIFKGKKKNHHNYLYQKIYRERNKLRLKRYRQEYYLKNRDRILAWQNEYYKAHPDKAKIRKAGVLKRKYEKYWEERMEKPINERGQHLIFSGAGNKYCEKLRAKNLEYLYRKAPELKDKVLSDDELMNYILNNEDI